MKMILFILLCFFAPASGQQAHAVHEIKAQKHFLAADVEEDNEDEEESNFFARKLNVQAYSCISHVLIADNPSHYKNSSTFFSERYIFHRVLRI